MSELYANQGGKGFVEVGRETGMSLTPKSGMNASFGDVFNDGRLAIYKTNISEPGVLVQGNDLWVPKAESGEGARQYENLASSMGVDLGGWSWGAQFGDLNNDGTLDLYLVNGYVSAGERSSYWYDFSAIAVGHSTIIADAKNWPPMRGRSLSGYQRKRVWLNDGLGRFTEVAQVGRGHRHVRRPRRRARRPRQSRRARRASSPTSAGRCSSTGTRSTPDATGFSSSWRAPTIAAPSAHESRSAGTAAGRCRR